MPARVLRELRVVTTKNKHGLIDLLDPDNFVGEMPYDELMEYLHTSPVFYHEDPRHEDGGFWLITRHEDVIEVSRHSDLFSSWENTALLTMRPKEMSEDELLVAMASQRMMMLNMDPPEHTKLRQIVNKGFTPRTIMKFKERLEELTNRILDRAIEKGEGDFVVDIAAELPLEAIAELMGVPSEDRKKIFDWSNTLVGGDDPEFVSTPEDSMNAGAELYAYAKTLGDKARDNAEAAMDDIVAKLIHTEIDGHKLDETEFEVFFLLLAVAGNETTRNAISHGMLAFFDHPDQWKRFVEERPLATAADEIIRWATPVMHFQRTATRDVEIGGQQIKKGQRVVIHYSTANRDPEVFDDPFTFDIFRDPNPHIAFGGGGAHFCLGSHLAKLEIEVIFDAIAERMPDIRPIGERSRLRSMFLNGIKHIPVSYVG